MASIQSKRGKTGKKVYYVVTSVAGRRKWIRAGTQQQAKILKRNLDSLGESQRFERLGLSKREKRVDKYFEEYANYISLRNAPGTVKRYVSVLHTFQVFLKMFFPAVRYLSQLDRTHIESYQRQRLESVELKVASDGDKPGNHKNKRLPLPQTVNNEVTMLAIALNRAHKLGMMAVPPTRGIKKLRTQAKREARILSNDEARSLLKSAGQLAMEDSRLKVYVAALRFLLNTGLRSGELCNLTWDDVELDSGVIKIRPKKGWTPKGAARQFYLNESSISTLRSLEKRSEYVFALESGRQLGTDDIRRFLIRAARVAGIKGLTRVHDLRHTFSSVLQMKGVDPGTVAAILGHQDLGTTRIYTHQTEEHLCKLPRQVDS